MSLDINKIITLGSGEKYLIISHVVNNEKDYYYIAELDENGKDIKDNYKIYYYIEISIIQNLSYRELHNR